jgi:hypothetical protein
MASSVMLRRVALVRPDVSEERSTCQLLELWFLASLIFDPEDGSDNFLRNMDSHTGYTALYPQNMPTLITTAV